GGTRVRADNVTRTCARSDSSSGPGSGRRIAGAIALELDQLAIARGVFERSEPGSWWPSGGAPATRGGDDRRGADEPTEHERTQAPATSLTFHGTIVRRCPASSSALSATCCST